MRDFFTRLAQRTIQPASVAQPLVPPMFASTGSEAHAESSASSEGEVSFFDKQVDERVAPETAGLAPLVNARRNDYPDLNREAVTANRPESVIDHRALTLEAPRNDRTIPAPLIERNHDTTEFVIKDTDGRDSTHRSAPSAESQPRAFDSQPVERPSPRPAITARPRVSFMVEQQRAMDLAPLDESSPGPAPSSINISIGRIEVRAITTASPQPPRAKPARTDPALSLDEYLRQRDERKR